MGYFSQSAKPVHLVLKRDKVRDLQRGFPWIYADDLVERPQATAGSLAILKDRSRAILAKGLYDPGSSLSFRVCALGAQRLDDALIESRLASAARFRLGHFDRTINAYRLINGEGDLLPGMVCDRYSDTAVLQFDGLGPAGFWNAQAIADWLLEQAGIQRVYLKSRVKTVPSRFIRGHDVSPLVECQEHGVRFLVDVAHGQKTGFFLDQRENRHLIGQFSGGRTVLNLFGYTGGFSVYAGAHQAAQVTTVDSSQGAVEAATENWKLNRLPLQDHEAVVSDVFDFLKNARASRRLWDLVIVDPPSFASSAKSIDAARTSYQRLFSAAAQVVAPGGCLAASSCSSRIGPSDFLDIVRDAIAQARCRARVLYVAGQPVDHPFPLACREMQYLKFVLMEIFGR